MTSHPSLSSAGKTGKSTGKRPGKRKLIFNRRKEKTSPLLAFLVIFAVVGSSVAFLRPPATSGISIPSPSLSDSVPADISNRAAPPASIPPQAEPRANDRTNDRANEVTPAQTPAQIPEQTLASVLATALAKPEDMEARKALFRRAGQSSPAEAVAALSQWRSKRNDAEAMARLAYAFVRNQQPEAAIAEFQSALSLDAGNPLYSFNIATLHEKLEQPALARRYYRQTLENLKTRPNDKLPVAAIEAKAQTP